MRINDDGQWNSRLEICVLLKLLFWKDLTWFGTKEKFKPRYIGPFEILQQIGEVPYRLPLPSKLLHVYDFFHVVTLFYS